MSFIKLLLLSLVASAISAPAFMRGRNLLLNQSPLTNCADVKDCGTCIDKQNTYAYECFWCPDDDAGSRCHAFGSPSTKCLGTDCISKSSVSICSSSTCPGPAPPTPSPPSAAMKVVIENKADLHLKVVEITDARSHARGGQLCDLQPASSCTVGKDFIVVSGSSVSGDPFDIWWGDSSWDKAQESIAVTVDPTSKGYLKYEKATPGGHRAMD